MPRITVIMATYNHANYVTQAIESVLNQRGVDFEFLIADDGSIDNTRDVVASIHDRRIQFFPNKVNRGACVVTNELIERASGEFIALINSDDYWIGSDKLVYQFQVMENNPNIGACFGRVRFIDEGGHTINKVRLPWGHVFDQPNRSQGAWLRHFFKSGNCICHPTMLIRKSCYKELGMYDNRLRQLPDFDMWIRLTKRYDIYISDRVMLAFRHLPGQNASSPLKDNYRRNLNELYFIVKNIFDGISQSIFLDGFEKFLITPKPLDKIHFDIEKSLLFFDKNRWSSPIYNLIGLENIYFLLCSDQHRKVLKEDYGIDDKKYHSMAAENCVFDPTDQTGQFSNIDGISLVKEIVNRTIQRAPNAFRLAFKNLFSKSVH